MGNTLGLTSSKTINAQQAITSEKDAIKLAIFRTLVKECSHPRTIDLTNRFSFLSNLQKMEDLSSYLEKAKFSPDDEHLFKSSLGVFKKLSKLKNPQLKAESQAKEDSDWEKVSLMQSNTPNK